MRNTPDLSNPSMSLFVLSMGRLFQVKRLMTWELTNLDKKYLERNDLILVAGIPSFSAENDFTIGAYSTPYSATIASSTITSQINNAHKYTGFYIKVEGKYYPVSLIHPDADAGNTHCSEWGEQVAVICTDSFGNHYWAHKTDHASSMAA